MSDCIEWKLARNPKGYGVTKRNGQNLAHRAVWVEAYGSIPDGFLIMHSCDNPPCINLEHLHIGTPAENTADMMGKRRNVSVLGLANGRAKLSDDDIRFIRARHNAGESFKAIARSLKLHPSYVSRVARGIRRATVDNLGQKSLFAPPPQYEVRL